ncbi:MAG: hypothetical protein ACKVH7_15230 [Alphaproteobacteria bacterium]|jgi:hypothetical protein
MTRPLPILLLMAGVMLTAAPALADDLALTCGDVTMVLTCGDGDEAGNCKTTSASDPKFDVTCTGSVLGSTHVRTICLNATEIGGTHVQEDFKIGDRKHALAGAVSTATGSSCEMTN